MDHLELLAGSGRGNAVLANKSLLTRVSGRFYTHRLIADSMIPRIVAALSSRRKAELRLCDPFCGDGRLIEWLLEAGAVVLSGVRLEAHLWDFDSEAVSVAAYKVRSVATKCGLDVIVATNVGDTFRHAPKGFGAYDVVITNPPWDTLKPDRRETELLGRSRAAYIAALRAQDDFMVEQYPLSQPSLKFSGWGTNLARVGTEVALRLTAQGGICAVVSPASLFADQVSASLRKWMFSAYRFDSIDLFPAESRLFAGVDQQVAAFVACSEPGAPVRPEVSRHALDGSVITNRIATLHSATAEHFDHRLSLNASGVSEQIFTRLAEFPRFGDMEGEEPRGLWAGREIDETNFESYLVSRGRYRFIKGRLVDRYLLEPSPFGYVAKDGPRIPKSADRQRIVWRDVSRPTQRRRLIATLAPPRTVAGNSLNVCYFRDDNVKRLKALLVVVNSFVFEFQVRANLATAHVSLGAVRKAHVPDLYSVPLVNRLAALADRCLQGDERAEDRAEVAVAKAYGLGRNELSDMLQAFPKIDEATQRRLTGRHLW